MISPDYGIEQPYGTDFTIVRCQQTPAGEQRTEIATYPCSEEGSEAAAALHHTLERFKHLELFD